MGRPRARRLARAGARVPSPAVSRYAFLRRPRFILFTVLMAGLVVLMVNLAFWQLRRLHERQSANATITQHVAEAPVPIGDVLRASTTAADADAAEWRSVAATGTYDPADQVLIRNRSLDSNAGYHVVTPLRLAGGSAVLVNRGWIPLEQQSEQLPTIPPPPTGVVTVTGRVRASQHKGRFFSPTDPPDGRLTQLYRVDVPRISEQVPYPLVPAYLELQSTDPPVVGAQPELIALPGLDDGPHLSYAVQWFFFSCCAMAGWILAVRRSARSRQRTADATARAETEGAAVTSTDGARTG